MNIGDLMSFWSGGRYKATKHRVRFTNSNAKKDRYSMAMFMHPNHETKLIPYGETKETSFDDQGDTVPTAGDYVERRFVDTYKN